MFHFVVRDLKTQVFWYPQGSWNQPLWVSRMTILNTSLKYCFPVIVVTKRGWFYITYTNEIQACNILYTIKPLWNVIRSNIFKFFFCVCVYAQGRTCECRFPWRLEYGIISPEDGVISECEPPNLGFGMSTKLRPSPRPVCSLNHWAISPWGPLYCS